MKKKELKKLAQKIANLEVIIDSSNDEQQIRMAKDEMLYYAGLVEEEDLFLLDEMIAEILEKNS